MNHLVSRRHFLHIFSLSAAAGTLAACTNMNIISINDQYRQPTLDLQPQPIIDNNTNTMASFAAMYGPMKDNDFNLPAIPYQQINPQYLRQIVDDPTGELPGTIVVDTKRRFLYLVRQNGRAIRYGVSIGREGFAWSGRAIIQYKRQWPTWTPPNDMIERQPELKKYSAANGGMKASLKNPLGARALYIFKDGVDTLYRLHGSPDWSSIGKAASSGCVRLINQDIIDLFERVPDKTPILVI